MKKLVAFVILLISFHSFGQVQGNLVINWSDKKSINLGPQKVNLPIFDAANFQYDASKRQLFYISQVPISAEINESSLKISNVVYADILESELGEIDITRIPSSIKATATNLKSRDELYASLLVSPIIKEGSSFKKVKSFTYSLGISSNRLSPSNSEFTSISNSALASGNWYRFFITKSGVYRISGSFLRDLGINVDAIDPRKIKIFGNGGRMIPLKNSEYYPADIKENAIQVIGESDGSFDSSDYILFYGEGVDQWSKDSQTTNNLYDSKSYYYINVEGIDGKRMQPMQQPSSPSDVQVNTFDDYQYYEVDNVNIVRLGRRWFGEQFDFTDSQNFVFKLPNVVTTSPVNLFIYAAAVSTSATSMEVKANNEVVGNLNFTPIGPTVKADAATINATIPANENITINLRYNNNGVPDSKGYLDYIFLKSKRNLTGYGKQFIFRYDLSSSSNQVGEYQINNAASIKQIWNITDIYNVTQINNENQSNFSFKANFGTAEKYIAVDQNDFYRPTADSRPRVTNQNLKGTIFLDGQGQFKDIDYLIITPSFLKNQAEKLANFHRTYSQYNVKVVPLETIYQEFASGKQDIGAIRNFVKYVYWNASSSDKRVKYLNLFGDASFDFKDRVSIDSNIVPIYHALSSFGLDPSSFASDDYFGLMDDNEGDLDTNYPQRIGLIDIAVGRILASTTKQADELVNKVIEYHDIKSYGSWRNNIVVVADDSDKDSDSSLQTNINSMAEAIVAEKPFLNYEKIILDSYVQETSAGGSRYPKARKELFDSFEKGALVLNYLGHGGEDGLSQERIWEKSDGQNLNNQFRYPLFITITCEFSRFDNPFRPTAGEFTYWNPKGGAISMITTVREIFQSTGENFNDVLAEKLFAFGSNNYVSIADALRISKNLFPARTDVVFYLGDPALKLAIAEPRVNLTKVNDVPINGAIENFKSLAYVKLSGNVTDENNNVLPAYNGELAVQIFDKKITRTTLNNDNNSPPINFDVLGETIFRGNATVTNGEFEFGFVVPRDIAIAVGNGKVSFYAKRGQPLFDRTGYNTTIKVGGINQNAAVDNQPPKVRLYMNDQNFISGGITNESPLFLAFLEDENGINTASGIGHDIVAILDGDESNPFKLNDYYETELDNYRVGKLKFPFRNLSKGLHTITFKAWDVYNNPVIAEIQFLVVGDESITISNVLNYPNPFVNYTEFWFTHNKPFEPLEIQVQVMTITGKLVWTRNQTVSNPETICREIKWDGKDDFGDRIGKGVYIYKLTVRSVLSNSKTEKYEKLVIL